MLHIFSWPLTKLGTWDLRLNKLDVSSSCVRSCEDFLQTAPLQQRITVESVNDMRFKQRAVIDFFVAEKESVRYICKHLCNVYGSATVDRNTVGRWAKSVSFFETSQAHLPRSGCNVTAVWPEMLAACFVRHCPRGSTHHNPTTGAQSFNQQRNVSHIIRVLGYSKVRAK
jgi:hypothetical protein